MGTVWCCASGRLLTVRHMHCVVLRLRPAPCCVRHGASSLPHPASARPPAPPPSPPSHPSQVLWLRPPGPILVLDGMPLMRRVALGHLSDIGLPLDLPITAPNGDAPVGSPGHGGKPAAVAAAAKAEASGGRGAAGGGASKAEAGAAAGDRGQGEAAW